MARDADIPAPRDVSSRRIIGFASYQAFAFFLFYAGDNFGITLGDTGIAFERVDLFAITVFMAVGFAIVRTVPARVRETLFSRPALYLCAVLIAVGSLAPLAFAVAAFSSPHAFHIASSPGFDVAAFTVEGVLAGVPSAIVLAAWGRTFGRAPMSVSVPEVFIGSLVAALVCLLIAFVPTDNPVLHAFRLLPLASVVNIEVPESAVTRPAAVEAVESAAESASSWSLKVHVGTLMFGIAAGLMAPLSTSSAYAGGEAVPHLPMSMVLFGAFLIGGLTLQLSSALGRGTALNKSYRLAVFLMLAGLLVLPWTLLEQSPMPGESIVLAGFLGLQTVLAALYLALADVTAHDAALSFAHGFLALFAGEACGIALANALLPAAEFAVSGLSGLLALAAYVFLFTERDFDEFSHVVTAGDAFEQTCADIVERYGLSNRESEILAFALRGRTSERIANELVISKSTVDTHLRRIYAKCGVHGRQELLDLAERERT